MLELPGHESLSHASVYNVYFHLYVYIERGVGIVARRRLILLIRVDRVSCIVCVASSDTVQHWQAAGGKASVYENFWRPRARLKINAIYRRAQ